ncbi:MAG: OsmC family protein [Chloroflexota bacterium]
MPDTSFAPLVAATRSALGASPTGGTTVTFRADSHQESGLRSVVRIRGFEVAVDEPPSLGGTDTAPNPVELALAALATCQEITYRLHADHLGIPLDGVAVTLEGDLDLRGFFGVDDVVRPGFTAIRGSVRLDSPAPELELERLKAHVDAHCPVLDLLSNPTPLTLELLSSPSSAKTTAI